MFSITRCLTVFVTLVLLSASLSAQDLESATEKFNESVKRLRTAIRETKEYGARYYHSSVADSPKWGSLWQASANAGVKAEEDLKDAAMEILIKAAGPSEDVRRIADNIFRERYKDGQYELAYEIAKRLCEVDPLDSDLELNLARAAIITNRFDEAKKIADLNDELLSELTEKELSLFRQLDILKKNNDEEMEIRQRESTADELPRVELETTKGKIVIELLENEAPGHVGNFISLVESGFYDGIVFHRVVKSFMAQAGAYSMEAPRRVNYTIYDECGVADARHHFRGSVSMACVPGMANSGSCQFFITFVPTPVLDGRHTVFGRIISDMRIVDSLTVTMEMDSDGKETPIEDILPDQIISARVLRKSDKEYKPFRVAK